MDYSDTFSLVAKLTSVCVFISLTASYDWDLHQLHIRNGFLYRDLQEQVTMEQPPRLVAQGEIGKMSSSKISVWFETKSSCLVWKIQSGS